MVNPYRAVGWNRQKKLYDRTLLASVAAFLALFVAASASLAPNAALETHLIRAFGAAAFTLLHVILSVGPLCRLDARFLPLLYNRRHMGVTMFGLALAHGSFAFVQYHAFGVVSPFVSLFAGDVGAQGFAGIPFQPLGALALAILFLMAATSHDFWLANLTAPVWKALHMLVYVAYGLLVLHVALGVLQSDRSPWLAALVGAGMVVVLSLHVASASKERKLDASDLLAESDGFVDACAADEIPEKRAKIVRIGGERVAVFRYGGKLSAVSNACQHQNGPLGEGKIVDGCITCPWHGYQYAPDTGASPQPFSEKVPTFRVRCSKGRVLVHATPLAPGTRVEPANIDGAAREDSREFYVGWQERAPVRLGARTRAAVLALAALGLCVAFVAAAHQRALGASRFEFGVEREFRGVVEARPYPTLRVARPQDGVSRFLLVAPGKHGAELASFDGRAVSLRGQLIYRDDRTMIEIAPESVREDAAAAPLALATARSLGERTLRGEIVDSKCHLGVMSPGERRTHRACAKLCIRGGIPPILWVEDEGGAVQKLVLVGRDGRAVNAEVLELVGERVEITGEVLVLDDLYVLRAEPSTYVRLDS